MTAYFWVEKYRVRKFTSLHRNWAVNTGITNKTQVLFELLNKEMYGRHQATFFDGAFTLPIQNVRYKPDA